MNKKGGHKTIWQRWYRYKYSGPITFGPLIFIIAFSIIYIYTSVDFFEVWSCDTLKNYAMNLDVPEDIIPHNELTEGQHIKLHKILQECIDNDRFSEPVEHMLNP